MQACCASPSARLPSVASRPARSRVSCSVGAPGASNSGAGDARKRLGSSGSSASGGGGGGQQRGGVPGATPSTAAEAEGLPRRWQRGPDDTLLRDANRDRLMGLLTERAAKTLNFYFSEMNPTLMQWLEYYMRDNPIPRSGRWEDVSGETFLRRLMSMSYEETRWNSYGREEVFICSRPIDVDPRSIAQRIMEIRGQIAKEWIEELELVDEENAVMMRETVLAAFSLGTVAVADPAQMDGTHPEMRHPDFE